MNLVTGVAGFIGSHLAQNLLREGHEVVGIDSFTSYYSKTAKLSNLEALNESDGFRFVEADISRTDLFPLLEGVDYVFHLAGQPGVRPSWGESFYSYVSDNILATQRLLEAAKKSSLRRFVFASSSSIYGDSERLPTPESSIPYPLSPYGATKLAVESMAHVYHKNFGVPTVGLRYFTVYGPRQRPDMAFNIFIRRISEGLPLEIYGDGTQSRDFTFVEDTVRATILSAQGRAGGVYNVGTGVPTPLNDVIHEMENIVGRKAKAIYRERALGDVTNTCADVSRIRSEVGFSARVKLKEGLKEQIDWQENGLERIVARRV